MRVRPIGTAIDLSDEVYTARSVIGCENRQWTGIISGTIRKEVTHSLREDLGARNAAPASWAIFGHNEWRASGEGSGGTVHCRWNCGGSRNNTPNALILKW